MQNKLKIGRVFEGCLALWSERPEWTLAFGLNLSQGILSLCGWQPNYVSWTRTQGIRRHDVWHMTLDEWSQGNGDIASILDDISNGLGGETKVLLCSNQGTICALGKGPKVPKLERKRM